jgi:hypothetical protein
MFDHLRLIWRPLIQVVMCAIAQQEIVVLLIYLYAGFRVEFASLIGRVKAEDEYRVVECLVLRVQYESQLLPHLPIRQVPLLVVLLRTLLLAHLQMQQTKS